MSCMEPLYVFFFNLLKQAVWRTVQHCFAVKLRKYFMDCKTSPDLKVQGDSDGRKVKMFVLCRDFVHR